MAYPSTLPRFEIDSYGYTDDDDVSRTQMEGGSDRVRRNNRQPMTVFQVATKMTSAQLIIFNEWYASEPAGGTEWFDIDLAIGIGDVTHSARFRGKPSPRKYGQRGWIVSCAIEVQARVVFDDEELEYAANYYGLAEILHDVLNNLPKTMGVTLWA